MPEVADLSPPTGAGLARCRVPAWFTLVVAAAALAVYANSLGNPLLYDDETLIGENPALRSWTSVAHLFDRQYFALFQELSYRPLPSSSYVVDYSIWGGRALGYHLTNVLLMAAAAAVAFLYLRSLFPTGLVAPVASILYAVHPVLTEVVNCAGFREDSVCAIFIFLTLLLYNRATDGKGDSPADPGKSPRLSSYVLSLLTALLALFSKETAIVLPVLLVAQDAILRAGSGRWRVRLRLYAGYVAVALLYCVVRFWLMKNPEETEVPYQAGGFENTLLTIPWLFATYLRLLLLPMHLSARYDLPPVTSVTDPRCYLSLLLLIGLAAVAVRRFRRSPILSFAILWFFIGLAPVSNLVRIGNLMAERFLSVSLLGYGLAVGLAVQAVSGSQRRGTARLALVAAGGIVAAMVFFTLCRNQVWGVESALWRRTAIVDPWSGTGWNGVGKDYIEKEMWAKAYHALEKSIGLKPDDSTIAYHLGVTMLNQRRLDGAAKWFGAILPRDPLYPKAEVKLAEVYRMERRYAEARKKLEDAARRMPDSPSPWIGLVRLAEDLRDTAAELKALRELRKRLTPGDPDLQTVEQRIQKLTGGS